MNNIERNPIDDSNDKLLNKKTLGIGATIALIGAGAIGCLMMKNDRSPENIQETAIEEYHPSIEEVVRERGEPIAYEIEDPATHEKNIEVLNRVPEMLPPEEGGENIYKDKFLDIRGIESLDEHGFRLIEIRRLRDILTNFVDTKNQSRKENDNKINTISLQIISESLPDQKTGDATYEINICTDLDSNTCEDGVIITGLKHKVDVKIGDKFKQVITD